MSQNPGSEPDVQGSRQTVLPLLGALTEPEGERERALHSDLRCGDADRSANAALQLGAAHIRKSPDVAVKLLLRAALAPSELVAGRALLRLARLAVLDTTRDADQRHAAAWRHVQEAQRRTAQDGGGSARLSFDLFALRIDLAVAMAFLPRGLDGAIRVLFELQRALHDVPDPSLWGPCGSGEHRHLRALVQLRLGQMHMGTAPLEADRHLHRAVDLATGGTLATAALERARLLIRSAEGAGPDIERLLLLAHEVDDPVVSPWAALELGDFLWRNGRPELGSRSEPSRIAHSPLSWDLNAVNDDPDHAETARELWARAAASGDRALLREVDVRLNSSWQREHAAVRRTGHAAPSESAIDLAEPLLNVVPTTALGRIASGRAPDAPPEATARRRVIVVGAGTGGHYLLPALEHGYDIAGFVDDSVSARTVSDHPVLGSIAQLPLVLKEDPGVEQVVIAIPTASGAVRLRVLKAVDRFNQAHGKRVAVVSLPSMFELRHGHPLQPQLRPLEVYETFGERPWLVDRQALRNVTNRRVVIAGASSALGSELARRVALARPRHLLLVDEPAVALRDLAAEIRDLRGLLDCDERIADLAAPLEFAKTLSEFPAPDVVLFTGGVDHASNGALPVPHAARANVLAPYRVVEAARDAGARDIIVASADRAGHRASAFDMTKAVGEAAVLAFASDRPAASPASDLRVADQPASARVSVLRLPNLWAKDGAVSRRLVTQLVNGGPLRVRDNRRRFAHAWEAAQTMLRLLDGGHDGGIFALAAGNETRVRTIAERLLLIHGLVAGRDIQIEALQEDETKASLVLWGRAEHCGEESVRGALHVTQDEDLRHALGTRSACVVEALSASRLDELTDPLAPHLPLSPVSASKARVA